MAAIRQECSICMKSFKNPKLIPCHHSFCYKCLEDYVRANLRNGRFDCPMCKRSVELLDGGVSAFQETFSVDSDYGEKFICDICGPKSVACSRCLDCEENLCQSCCYCHEKSKASRHHKIVDFGTLEPKMKGRIRQRIFCDQHPEEEIKLVCQDCKVLICVLCKAVNHDHHATKTVSDTAAEVKQAIRIKMNKCSDKVKRITDSEQEAEALERKINDAEQKELKTLEDQRLMLIKVIDQEVANMKYKMENVYKDLREQIAAFKRDMKDELKTCSTANESASKIVDQGIDIDIIKKGPDLEQLLYRATLETVQKPMIIMEDLFLPVEIKPSEIISFIGMVRDSTQMNLVKEFAPGQVVQVLDNINSVKKMQEERVGWNEKMTRVIGKKGQVESINEDRDVQVSFGEYTWTFNADCLVATQGKPDVINYEDDEDVRSFSQPGPEEITSNTLFASIMIGDFKGVKNILQKEPQMMLLKEEEDKTPLHMASNCGNVEIVDFLCQQGVPLDDVDSDGNTPLLVASDKGHLNVMKLLIEKGANKNAKNKNDEGAIFLMVKQRNKEGLKLLQKFECDINSKDNLSQTPLYEAINSNDEELLSIILGWPKLDISGKDKMGFSPLCYACKKGSVYTVKKLLQMGADINDQRENTGHTGLHLAVYNNRRDIVDYLLKMPMIHKECRTKEGQSALHIATKEGFFEIMQLLIESGLDINGVDNNGNTCLHFCVTRKVTEEEVTPTETIVMYLIQKGVDVNFKNQDEQTAFDLAPDQLKVLLEPRLNAEVNTAEVNTDGTWSLPTSSYGQTAEDVGPTSLPTNLAPPMCGECEEERAVFLLLPCGHGICKDCKGVKPKKKCPSCAKFVKAEKAI